ncbi:MAG: DUF4870 domain-containing protein [Planctomycetes bacterium]|nr:DUF4870 domain-containing protein [Planctomycetota bacterium]
MTDTTPTPDEPLPPPVPPTDEPRGSGPAGWPGEILSSATDRPPEKAPVQEVDAVPLSKRETRGPSIQVEAERRSAAGDAGAAGNPPPPSPGGQAAAAAPYTGTRAWAVLMHLAYLIPFNLPGLIVTLVIWLSTRRDDPFADHQGREALNFQLVYAGVSIVLGLSCFLSWLYFPVWVLGAVLSIVAAVEAGDGKRHRYPYIFRLIG